MHHLPRPEGATPDDFKLSRRAIAGLFAAGYALGAGPLRAEPITTSSEGLFTATDFAPSGDARLPVYVAMPEGARRRPVVVVVPEIFGLHEYIRDVARRLAKAGYVGVAFDPFVRAGDPSKLSETAPIIAIVETATDAQVMGDVRAVISWLGTNPKLGRGGAAARVRFADMRRVGITGFCWGGAVVWMAAARIAQIKAGVAWYGRLVRPAPTAFLGKEERQWPLDVAAELKAPVLGLYAGEDRGIPLADVERMQAALAAAGKDSRIEIFPGAAHGFHADYRAVYNKEAAEAGWAKLLDWFGRRL